MRLLASSFPRFIISQIHWTLFNGDDAMLQNHAFFNEISNFVLNSIRSSNIGHFCVQSHGQKRQKTTVPGDDFSGCAITGFISLLNYVHVCGLVFNGVVRMQWPTRCVCWQWPEWNKKYCINFSLCDLQIENILKNRRHAIFFRWHEKKKQRQGSTCMICSFKTNSFL